MTVLNDLAHAAAVLLLIELLVVVLIFLAVAGGLGFGTHWLNGKTGVAFAKINGFVPKAISYVDRAGGYAAKPFIAANGLVAMVRTSIQSLASRGRGRAISPSPVPAYSGTPALTDADLTAPLVSVDGATRVVASEDTTVI